MGSSRPSREDCCRRLRASTRLEAVAVKIADCAEMCPYCIGTGRMRPKPIEASRPQIDTIRCDHCNGARYTLDAGEYAEELRDALAALGALDA